MTFKDRLIRAFSIDYRSLAAFRIALGVGLIAHAITFVPGMLDFFADGGLASARPEFPNLFWISTSKGFVALVFLLQAASGMAIIYNFYSRVAAAFSYLVILSITWRTPEVTYGVDALMRFCLLWLFFLPRGPSEGESSSRFTSAASVVALGQIVLLYCFTGFLKDGQVWLHNGLSVYNALRGYTFTTNFGHFLTATPMVILKLASVGVLALERFGPLLIFTPFYFASCRTFLFLAFALMHLLFVMCLHIGLFAYFDIALVVLILPGEFWDEFKKFRVLRSIVLSKVKVTEPVLIRRLLSGMAVVAFLIATISNFHSYYDLRPYLPASFFKMTKVTGLEQRWFMFAPFPSADAGIYIASGLTMSGRVVDVYKLSDNPPNFTLDGDWIYRLPNARWLSYMRTRYHRADLSEGAKRQFADYFCSRWMALHGEPLKEVSLWHRYELLLKMPGSQGARQELFTEPCEPKKSSP